MIHSESAAKKGLLGRLDIGQPVAEAERDALAAYFVETDQWRRLLAGKVDIVYGAKGSGKSALYFLLMQSAEELAKRDIEVVEVERPQGVAAFASLAENPPSSESLFVSVWKLYFLSLIGRVLKDWGVDTKDAKEVYAALESAGLLPRERSLPALLKRAQEYVVRVASQGAVEATIKLDPATGQPVGIGAKIALSEPGADAERLGVVSISDLLMLANRALHDIGMTVWLVADRLDAAFDDRAVESRALRALFRTYLDLHDQDRVKLKLFLRSDIWNYITRDGFREASHIVRTTTLTWNKVELLQLVARRILKNPEIAMAYKVPNDVDRLDLAAREEFVNRLFPEHLDDQGGLEPFDWIVEVIQDATRSPVPRELIELLAAAREAQIQLIESGHDHPEKDVLFERHSVLRGWADASKQRLEQTLYAEHQSVRRLVSRLEGEPWQLNLYALTGIWGFTPEQTETTAENLVELGFFERRRSRRHPVYVVAPIYRPALKMRSDDGGEAFRNFGKRVLEDVSTILHRQLIRSSPEIMRYASDETSEEIVLRIKTYHGPMRLWLFAAEGGTALSLRNPSSVICAGLLDDDERELDRDVFGHRMTGFRWLGHFKSERHGFRLHLSYEDVQGRSVSTVAKDFAGRIVKALDGSDLIP